MDGTDADGTSGIATNVRSMFDELMVRNIVDNLTLFMANVATGHRY